MARLFNDASSQGLFASATPITAVPFTVSLWMYADDVAISPVLFYLGDKDSDFEYFSVEFRGTEASDPVAIVARSVAAGRIQTNSTTGVTVNQWHHVCGVFTSTTSRTIYLDGGSSATGVTSVTPLAADRTAVGYLARLTPTGYHSGGIAEVGLWDVALTAGEIGSLAKALTPMQIRPQNLQRYWPLLGRTTTEPDWMSLEILSETAGGGSKTTHPRMIYPSRKRLIKYTPAVGGGIAGPLVGGRLTRSDLILGRLVT